MRTLSQDADIMEVWVLLKIRWKSQGPMPSAAWDSVTAEGGVDVECVSGGLTRGRVRYLCLNGAEPDPG